MEKLQELKVFPEGGRTRRTPDSGTPRRCIGELYEPLEIHRQLGLPMIDWNADVPWRDYSEEGSFTF
jgi:hypothetical protein